MIISTSENRRKPQQLKIGEKIFEGVTKFKYLGNVTDNGNQVNECIKDRIQAGNRAYAANYNILKSKSISRTSKLNIYRTLIRPVATYGAESWAQTQNDEEVLNLFERKILRKIYGPIQDKGEWRIRYNHELEALQRKESIVRFIKAQRLRWAGHVMRMEDNTMPKIIINAKLYSSRKKGRPKKKWIEGVTGDLTKIKVERWK